MHIIPWYERPEAQTLLLSCAANPPKVKRNVKVYVQTRDEWLVYVGARVDKLSDIREVAYYEAEAHALTLPREQHGEVTLRTRFDVSPEMAIDAVRFDGERITQPWVELPEIRFEARRDAA